jgi:O-antigen/teichoic acid export membrane protein
MSDPAATDRLADRIDLRGRTLRAHTARGTIINAAFTVGIQTLGLARGFVLAAFIAPREYGIWGIVVVALGTLTWLKQIGVGEKFVQQDDDDQELAFQHAFTVELITNVAMVLLLAAAIPLAVVVYDEPAIVPIALAVLLVFPAYSLQPPLWVFYRRMDFVRQRTMQAIDPVVGSLVAIGLAIAGAGAWAFVAGMIAGAWATGLVVWRMSPYPLRLKLRRNVAREYAAFSWPLFVSSASGIVVAQATTIAASRTIGVAAVGALSLSHSFTRYTHRVDGILTSTLYPAICAVKDRRQVLAEAFVKSNRLTLMWGLPFAIGLSLFVADLIHFVIGDEWTFAVALMQATAITAGIEHIGYNWHAFYRAQGNTRPMATYAVVNLVLFLIGPIPLLIAFGLDELGYGMIGVSVVLLGVRAVYLSKLFGGFNMLRHTARAIAPTVPGLAAVLLVRAADLFERTFAVAVGEVLLFAVLTVLATWVLERRLLREAIGYLRKRQGSPFTPAPESP